MTCAQFMAVFRLLIVTIVFVAVSYLPVRANTTELVVIDPVTGTAVYGYDVVAFFTEQEAVKGSDQFEVEWRGAYWHFANAANADRFRDAPDFYTPQFNGYGAQAVADGRATDGNPVIWAIFDNQLFFFHSIAARSKWVRDVSANVQAGKANWPGLSRNLSR